MKERRASQKLSSKSIMDPNQNVKCKIVVVGDSQCGKTALLHVFAKDCFPEVSAAAPQARDPRSRGGLALAGPPPPVFLLGWRVVFLTAVLLSPAYTAGRGKVRWKQVGSHSRRGLSPKLSVSASSAGGRGLRCVGARAGVREAGSRARLERTARHQVP